MIRKPVFQTAVVMAIAIGLSTSFSLVSECQAQKKDTPQSKEAEGYLAKARAFSKLTGRPIFVVAGSKT